MKRFIMMVVVAIGSLTLAARYTEAQSTAQSFEGFVVPGSSPADLRTFSLTNGGPFAVNHIAYTYTSGTMTLHSFGQVWGTGTTAEAALDMAFGPGFSISPPIAPGDTGLERVYVYDQLNNLRWTGMRLINGTNTLIGSSSAPFILTMSPVPMLGQAVSATFVEYLPDGETDSEDDLGLDSAGHVLFPPQLVNVPNSTTYGKLFTTYADGSSSTFSLPPTPAPSNPSAPGLVLLNNGEDASAWKIPGHSVFTLKRPISFIQIQDMVGNPTLYFRNIGCRFVLIHVDGIYSTSTGVSFPPPTSMVIIDQNGNAQTNRLNSFPFTLVPVPSGNSRVLFNW